jgi:kinetochore protein Mis12/MTW1
MTATRPVSSTLLQEILRFAPELFLDDIVDSANNAIYQCVNAMEPFLRRWLEQRTKPLEPPVDDPDWSPEAEIEQGLVAFQTLLENHVDIAFDFFDVWCRRNVFSFNPDLPIVVPHQRDLDLSIEPERETELFTDIDELRRGIDNASLPSHLSIT